MKRMSLDSKEIQLITKMVILKLQKVFIPCKKTDKCPMATNSKKNNTQH